MEPTRDPYVFGSALRRTAAPLLDELWFPDQARLKALLELSIARDIKLSDCLEALFPDKDRKSAPAHFRSFRKRSNDAAARRGIALQCDLDRKRRSAPGDRRCWFSGANPAEAATSGNAVMDASIDVLNFIGLLLGGELRGARALPTAQETDAPLDRLNQILGSSLPAATPAFRYWLHPVSHALPTPAPRP